MNARAVFHKIVGAAYWWANNKLPRSIREAAAGNGNIRDGKPGEFIMNRTSPEDRQALQELKSDDIAPDTYNKEDANWAAQMGSTQDWYRDQDRNMVKEEKLKFDKLLIKDPPRADRKKY